MDNIKKKFQIVVARYNENIEWLLPLKDITIIYNKGNNIPLLNKFNTIYLSNIGRESHTYLNHIINNYDILAEKTIFFQGKIDDHKKNILDIEDYFKEDDFIGKFDILNINTLKNNINHYGKYKEDLKNGNLKKCYFTPYDWITNIIGIDMNENVNNIKNNTENTKVVWNAIFSISKNLILSKPKIFYQNILRFVNDHSNPEEGHYLERTWYLLFNNKYIKKDTIYYYLINNYKDVFKVKQLLKNEINEIHLWVPLISNYEYGYNNNIKYMQNINKYILIKPLMHNNNFKLKIKSEKDIYIFIEFENHDNNIEPDKYEIILGGWNNTRTIIRDYNKNNIIKSYENKTLDNNKYINFNFTFQENVEIKKDNDIIFNFVNNFKKTNIKSIKIKNFSKINTFLDYEHFQYIEMNNTKDNDIYLNEKIDNKDNIKIFLYDSDINIETFYKNNYLNNYIDELNIFNLLCKNKPTNRLGYYFS
jgi:hypothetical protein